MKTTNLIRYNHQVRQLYYEVISKLSWKEFVKARGASFDSIRNIFLHLTLVEDRWINYIIPNRFGKWVDLDFDKFDSFEKIEEYMVHTKESSEKYLQKLSLKELDKKIIIPWGNKADTYITVETALNHMVIEDLIHYGELSALLWQMNIEPPYLAFWRYIYQRPNNK